MGTGFLVSCSAEQTICLLIGAAPRPCKTVSTVQTSTVYFLLPKAVNPLHLHHMDDEWAVAPLQLLTEVQNQLIDITDVQLEDELAPVLPLAGSLVCTISSVEMWPNTAVSSANLKMMLSSGVAILILWLYLAIIHGQICITMCVCARVCVFWLSFGASVLALHSIVFLRRLGCRSYL